MRRIFVGDVQGCRDELERLLEALKFDPAADELHPVGDMVNRGPDSAGTLRLAMELDAGGVLGNHDLHLLRVALGRRATGRRDTIEDVLDADDREELIAWLGARPFLRTWDDVYLVHAALNPAWKSPQAALRGIDWRIAHPASEFAVRARYCDVNGVQPESDWPPPEGRYRPWFELYPPEGEQRTVVFGHWSRMGLVERPQVRGLDTGCVWGGELTAWVPDEDRFVSVKAARCYAPTSIPD